MKVKSCYIARLIDTEDQVKEYTEELNCTVRHRFSPSEGIIVYTIEDATGNKSVLFTLPEPYRAQFKDRPGLRVVVDNIQEGIEFFKSKGYEPFFGPVETETNIICAMSKDKEFKVLFEHKKH